MRYLHVRLIWGIFSLKTPEKEQDREEGVGGEGRRNCRGERGKGIGEGGNADRRTVGAQNLGNLGFDS